MTSSREHTFNDDAVCVHCGFDGAEWWHLERQKPQGERTSQPPCSKPRGYLGSTPDGDIDDADREVTP